MLRIDLLGPFEVRSDDGARIDVPGNRMRSLLAILALTPGETVSAATLIDRCWDEAGLIDVRASLQTAIARLRRRLADAPGGPATPITTTGDGYALNAAAVEVDVTAFGREPARDGPAGPGERERLDAALALWRGEPFDGGFCDWLQTDARRRLTERWLTTLERSADLHLLAGAPDRALAELQEPAAAYPLRETLSVRLLTALDLTGRRAEALERYGQVRAHIAAELGVEPGPGLRAVFDRLLAGDDSPAPAGPAVPAVPAADRKERRARAPGVPQQLPADLPHFLGRSDLLEQLDELAGGTPEADGQDHHTTTVVLHGLGGSGKTSLAVHWAHRVGDRFPGGRLFLDLHGFGPGDPVPPVTALGDLLHALGVNHDDVPPGQDARSALLRSTLAGRQVLLVLDNARDEEQVRPLLPGAGSVVLVTARGRLSGLVVRDGGRGLPVTPLPGDEAVRFLAARLDCAPAGLDELAARCGGLPLALAIVTQRLRDRPGGLAADGADRADGDSLVAAARRLAELADRSTWLDVLEGHDAASDVRTVLRWSYAALPPEAARFFRLLGAAMTPVVTAAAAAVLAGTTPAEASRALRRLAELNLLTEVRRGRYRMHDLLVSFAVERCDAEDGAGERLAAERRLLEWYVHSVYAALVAAGRDVEVHDPGPPGPGVVPRPFGDADDAREWLEQEGVQMAGVVVAAAREGHHADAARLGVLLWDVLYRRADTDRAATVQRIAIASARRLGLRRLEALAVNQLGTTFGVLGDLETAEQHFTAAARTFEELHDPGGGTIVQINLTHLHKLRGDTAGTLRHAETAATLAHAAGHPRNEENALEALARAYLGRGDVHAARRAVDDAARVGGRVGDVSAAVVDTLGQVLAADGEPAAAAVQFQAARARHREEGDAYWSLDSTVKLGIALRDSGRPADALDAWREALDLLGGLDGPRVTYDREHIVELMASVTGATGEGAP